MVEQTDHIEINEDEIRVDVYRSSGPGGQGVNTTDSAVRITHLPTGIVVSCQNERSQIQNRARAMAVLQAKLLERRRQEEADEMAALRGEAAGSWGTQIRNYVLHPYQIVKDVRTGMETGNTTAVLDGEIDDFIEAEIRWLRRTQNGEKDSRRVDPDEATGGRPRERWAERAVSRACCGTGERPVAAVRRRSARLGTSSRAHPARGVDRRQPWPSPSGAQQRHGRPVTLALVKTSRRRQHGQQDDQQYQATRMAGVAGGCGALRLGQAGRPGSGPHSLDLRSVRRRGVRSSMESFRGGPALQLERYRALLASFPLHCPID